MRACCQNDLCESFCYHSLPDDKLGNPSQLCNRDSMRVGDNKSGKGIPLYTIAWQRSGRVDVVKLVKLP